jgi:hypothetical protein
MYKGVINRHEKGVSCLTDGSQLMRHVLQFVYPCGDSERLGLTRKNFSIRM